MAFGWRRATVTAPASDAARRPPDEATAPESIDSGRGLLELRAQADAPRAIALERDVALLADELVWLKERFGKLQNRVTAELREVRREVDRLTEDDPYDPEDDRE